MAPSIPSFWNVGGIRMSVTSTCGSSAIGLRDELVVVAGDADDVDASGRAASKRTDAFADDEVVVGEQHGDRLSTATITPGRRSRDKVARTTDPRGAGTPAGSQAGRPVSPAVARS